MANAVVLNLRVSRSVDDEMTDLAVGMTSKNSKLTTKSDIYRRAIEYGLPFVKREVAGVDVGNVSKLSYPERLAKMAAILVQKGLAVNNAEIEAAMVGYAEN